MSSSSQLKSKLVLAISLAMLLATAAPSVLAQPIDEPAGATSPSADCTDGVQASGARYRICMPSAPIAWNGELVVYAHGYVAYNEPVAIPENQLVLGGISVPDIVTMLGYAFATTSYYTNGLAVQAGIADLVDLVDVFQAAHGASARTYLTGVSEGGLITALAVEQYPDIFDGGLATCGPVGSFREQINYFGDFRVVFDYFFPGLMPGEAVTIPQALIDGWSAYYTSTVEPAIIDPANAYSLTQVFSVTHAAYDPANPATMITSAERLLWYNVFSTNDGKLKLGGQPFDNTERVYSGSADDTALNDPASGVKRFKADQATLEAMQAGYQTSGRLNSPMVTLHTTLDEIVPYFHEDLYRELVVANNRQLWHTNIPVERYGHCNFTQSDVTSAFTTLVNQVRTLTSDLATSRKSVIDSSGDGVAQASEVLTYTITITNSGTVGAGIILTDELPAGLDYAGYLAHNFPGTGFTAVFSGNVLMAHTEGYLYPPAGGSLSLFNTFSLTFTARVSETLPGGTHIVNTIQLRDQDAPYTIPPASIGVERQYGIFLPVILRNA
ncbi:MAG: DUF11 domain-containing protein [Thermoflexales bacterium]|nr:DUF11 domain-containing protein [Thermoflexales bacterium]